MSIFFWLAMMFSFCVSKFKSAATEVTAPKNANSNCRQTTKKRQVYLVPQLEGICVFTKFEKLWYDKKSISTPWGKYTCFSNIKGCLAPLLYHGFDDL